MNLGYTFYFDTPYGVLTFPITPEQLSIKAGSNNSTITLISEGEVNLLKSPSLMEIEFKARFPMRQYPYAREFKEFKEYFDIFTKLKEEKKSFRFIVTRTTPGGTKTWDTNILVSLENMSTDESVDQGDDVVVSFSLKQYKNYGIKIIELPSVVGDSNLSGDTSRDTSTKKDESVTYTVKSGDTLWSISKTHLGDATDWPEIYDANKSTIESTAKKHGKASSSNGHWIYPGTELTIPANDAKSAYDAKKKSSSSVKTAVQNTKTNAAKQALNTAKKNNSTTTAKKKTNSSPAATNTDYVMPVVHDIKKTDTSAVKGVGKSVVSGLSKLLKNKGKSTGGGGGGGQFHTVKGA